LTLTKCREITLAETEEDMQALLLGAAAVDSEPLSFCRECEASNAFSLVLKRRISRGITDDFNG